MRAPGLRELQERFWRSIAAEPGGADPGPDVVPHVASTATLAPEDRIRVYADAYFWRLRDVLGEDFPRLAALLGVDRFADLARDYLRRHPSEHPSVRHLGREMGSFLAGRPGVPSWAADLARLEWARIEAFDAPDADPLLPGALHAVAADRWPALHFVTVPSLRVLRLGWPVHVLWDGGDPDAITRERTAIRVWRGADDRVYHAVLDGRAVEMLDQLVAGAPFVVLCEACSDLAPDEGARAAASLLARWLADGLIARLS
jgi:hypothetical protein